MSSKVCSLPARCAAFGGSRRLLRAALAGASLALLLAGCTSLRVDPPKPAEPSAQFKEATQQSAAANAPADGGAPWQPALAASNPTPDDWWTLFNDPVLDDLERRLVIGNENLKSVLAQIDATRAALAASREAFFPTLSAGLTGTRTGSASTNSSNNANFTARPPSNTVQLSANASWEADLWGRLRLASQGAQASLQASVDDLASARLSAQALLAQTYFSLRAAEAQRALYERSVAAYQRTVDLTQARFGSGVVGATDVLQAQTQLRSAQAQVAEAVASRAQLEHAIAVLLGSPPSGLSIAANGALPPTFQVPELLPSTLLERRPDIAAAQRRVAVAFAQIGIARAAYFPSLTLSANGGYTNSTLANLINVPNLFWSLGASVAQSIFDGGQRRLASAQARANADVATSTYRQTVIVAFQEVEDNLVLADQLQRETQLQSEALQSAQRNLEITLDQYRAGTVSYINVATAQAAALSSESSLITVRSRQLSAVNTLMKNIAGRWTPA